MKQTIMMSQMITYISCTCMYNFCFCECFRIETKTIQHCYSIQSNNIFLSTMYDFRAKVRLSPQLKNNTWRTLTVHMYVHEGVLICDVFIWWRQHILCVCVSIRATARRRRCTSPTRTSASTSCCRWRCSTATTRTSASSSASASRSSRSRPRRSSRSRTPTVSAAARLTACQSVAAVLLAPTKHRPVYDVVCHVYARCQHSWIGSYAYSRYQPLHPLTFSTRYYPGSRARKKSCIKYTLFYIDLHLNFMRDFWSSLYGYQCFHLVWAERQTLLARASACAHTFHFMSSLV